MRNDYPKPIVYSRLKSYIDGNLKLEDIKHPSKIALQEPHIRTISRLHTNYENHQPFPNYKLKAWSVKTESRIGAYIHGEMTIRELVHPSKITELSQQAIQQKIRKNKLLTRRPVHQLQHRRRQQVHWTELGKQLDRIAPTANRGDSLSDISQSPTELQCVAVPTKVKEQQPAELKNTLVFNGNVNILCLNMAQKQHQLDYPSKPQQIFENMQQDVLNAISLHSAHPGFDAHSQFDSQRLMSLCVDSCDGAGYIPSHSSTKELIRDIDIGEACIDLRNTDELVATVSMLTATLQDLNCQYQNVVSDCYELTKERQSLLEHQEISDKAIDKLKNRMHELKRQNELSEIAILQLSDEVEVLECENQTIILHSENTIHHLTEEFTELKRKNETLAKLSRKTIQQLRKETKDLKQHNKYLADKLNEKIVTEESVHLLREKIKQLKMQNHILTIELQQEIAEKNNLNLWIEEFKTNLQSKIKNIEQCFNLVLESIQKTENDIKTMHTGDRNILLKTIHELDDQNTSLMVKVKLFPEMVKRTLAHVSCSMSALEEQNLRLLRALQNTEIEHLTEATIRRRMRALRIE